MSGTSDGNFMYFAFGSNLLRERLQLKNPSAAFVSTGRLKMRMISSTFEDSRCCRCLTGVDKRCRKQWENEDYKLNFGLWEENAENSWHGGVATIESCQGEEVWGVVWTLSNENLPTLDNQEGVSRGMYSPLEVSVETDEGVMQCRTYQMNNFHASPPSPQYKQVVCQGAEQNGLPRKYLERLEAIQTNNYSGPSVLDQI